MIQDSLAPGRSLPTPTGAADEASLAAMTDGRAVSGLAGIRRMGLALVALDAVGAVAALLTLRAEPGRIHWIALHVSISIAIWVAIFHMFGLHRVKHLSAWDEFRGTISATAVGLLVLMVVASRHDWSSPRLAGTAIVVLALELAGRRGLRWLVASRERRGGLVLRTAVIGANGEATSLVHALRRTGRGFVPVGYVAIGEVDPEADGLPIIGDIDSLEDAIRRQGIDCVLVAASAASSSDMLKIARACRRMGVEMKVSANLPDALCSRMSVQRIGEFPAVSLRPVRLTRLQDGLKRSFDLAGASLLLLLASPFMLAVSVAIRLTSEGPGLFRQTRVTKGGRPFTMFKFRTMVEDTEHALDGAVIDLTQPFFKLKDDPRLTGVGKWLRLLSLDELPQLWNVILGDMSLVGPRPLPVEQVEANADFLAPRHEVRAGITGWWQISGRSDLETEDALRQDVFYIENWSLGLDVYILLRTLGTVVGTKGAW